MKEPYGYYTQHGYKGYVERLKRFILFETLEAYYDYIGY